MKKISSLLFGVFLMASASVWAAPLLSSYTHNYGNASGQVDPGGNDPLSNGYVTVKDSSSQRFNDAFDFSALSFSSIDHFDLTLQYSGTNNSVTIPFLNITIPLELWYARPGGTPDQFLSFSLPSVGTKPNSLTFTIDSSLDPEFAQMVTSKNFFFWFAETTPNLSGTDEFRLHSATLDIYGVPEPTSLALLGLALAGMGSIRRKKQPS